LVIKSMLVVFKLTKILKIMVHGTVRILSSLYAFLQDSLDCKPVMHLTAFFCIKSSLLILLLDVNPQISIPYVKLE